MQIPKLIELLSDLEHQQWKSWVDHIIETYEKPNGTVVVPKEKVRSWKRQSKTDYLNLTEEEKDLDREWAIKIVNLIVPNNK